MHEVLVNRLGAPSLPRKVGRLTGRPDMTLDVYRGRKTTAQQQQQIGGGTSLGEREHNNNNLYTYARAHKTISNF